jgi:1-acyl-sn-glycerol-3-phosphate acyltransferase
MQYGKAVLSTSWACSRKNRHTEKTAPAQACCHARLEPAGRSNDAIALNFAGESGAMSVSRMAWAVFNALQLVFTLLWTAGWICLALLVLLLARRRNLPLRMAARCWAPGLLHGSGAKLVVRGLERVDWSRPHVLVANHQSMIDICALFRAVPVPLQFLLKQELSKVPFVGAYAKAMGMIFIERGSAREATKRMREAAQLVRDGATLCVFPEGTRSRDGEVLPFKSGAFQIALDAGADVVPVAIEGSGQVLSLGGVFRVRPGPITLVVGAPLRTAEAADRQQLADRARASVLALQREARGEMSGATPEVASD